VRKCAYKKYIITKKTVYKDVKSLSQNGDIRPKKNEIKYKTRVIKIESIEI